MRNFWVCITILCVSTAGCENPSTVPPSTASQSSQHDTITFTPNTSNSDENGNIIVAFGNSLTSGLGVSQDEAYPAQLEARLRAMGYPYRVVNAGISGDTTAAGLRRLDGVIKTRPKIVILELGANDGLRGIDLTEIRANLSQMIRRLQAEEIQVVLAGMKLPPNYGLQYTIGFLNLYKDLAKEYGITLIPFFLDGVAAKAELNQDDGIHPTAEGYRLVVDNVLPSLLPLLKRIPAD